MSRHDALDRSKLRRYRCNPFDNEARRWYPRNSLSHKANGPYSHNSFSRRVQKPRLSRARSPQTLLTSSHSQHVKAPSQHFLPHQTILLAQIHIANLLIPTGSQPVSRMPIAFLHRSISMGVTIAVSAFLPPVLVREIKRRVASLVAVALNAIDNSQLATIQVHAITHAIV